MLHALRHKLKAFIKKRRCLEPLSKQNILAVAMFSRFFEKIKDVPGAVVECGVYRGKGLSILATLAKTQKKQVYGFDSFEGFEWQGKSWFTDVTMEKVERFLKKEKIHNVHLIKGYFKETLPVWTEKIGPISFLIIDCDLHDSYLSCFDFLWDTVSTGGIVLLDEYDAPQDIRVWYEPKKTIDEFCKKKNLMLRRDEVSGKVYFVKP